MSWNIITIKIAFKTDGRQISPDVRCHYTQPSWQTWNSFIFENYENSRSKFNPKLLRKGLQSRYLVAAEWENHKNRSELRQDCTGCCSPTQDRTRPGYTTIALFSFRHFWRFSSNSPACFHCQPLAAPQVSGGREVIRGRQWIASQEIRVRQDRTSGCWWRSSKSFGLQYGGTEAITSGKVWWTASCYSGGGHS